MMSANHIRPRANAFDLNEVQRTCDLVQMHLPQDQTGQAWTWYSALGERVALQRTIVRKILVKEPPSSARDRILFTSFAVYFVKGPAPPGLGKVFLAGKFCGRDTGD